MNGIILQQVNLIELEDLVRRLLREELSALDLSPKVFKPPDLSDEPLLSKSQCAELLGISLPTLAKMIKDRTLTPIKVGKRFKFQKSQLLNFLNKK
jgi:excisionase family DNA binding protein